MKGIIYQLKNIRRDKLCLLTFLLPIIVGLGINLLSDPSFSSISETSFGIVEQDTTTEMSEWLKENGRVTRYSKVEELYEAVNDPATQMIGVTRHGEGISTILSGDEFQLYKTTGAVLPTLYTQRESMNTSSIDIRPATSNNKGLKSLLIVITMVTAMFMGCTFNAMNIIGEKEDGISFINEILPMSQQGYIGQKIILGFIGGGISTIVTALICMRVGGSQMTSLLILILLSTFIAALLGLFIGRFSQGMMVGIVYIKIFMILFIAPPILFYLVLPADSIFKTISYFLPSSATFYGLMDLINGQMQVNKYIFVLLFHCIIWFLLYFKVDQHSKNLNR
ncbi:ABC transporter permease [Enterococcus sp. AZ109]|uniref:ABC transporter permease n=1 Tax=Enterococcus sp. AZ109 TaxID=2774634 RepID=UPI003F232946